MQQLDRRLAHRKFLCDVKHVNNFQTAEILCTYWWKSEVFDYDEIEETVSRLPREQPIMSVWLPKPEIWKQSQFRLNDTANILYSFHKSTSLTNTDSLTLDKTNNDITLQSFLSSTRINS